MESKKFKALDIANYIIWYANENNLGSITPLKLQKVLYYVATHYLQSNDKPLFLEPIQKWQYGPVVKEVYHSFKSYGFERIVQPKSTIEFIEHAPQEFEFKIIDFDPSKFVDDTEFTGIANTVIKELSTKSAFHLVEMTHQESSWSNFRNKIMHGEQDLIYSIDELKQTRKLI